MKHTGLPAIPYDSRLIRALRRRQEHIEMLATAERVARETNTDIGTVIDYASKLPGDPIALRGIPAIGRGVGGAIHRTRPGDGLT
jgi:hypothetical protein